MRIMSEEIKRQKKRLIGSGFGDPEQDLKKNTMWDPFYVKRREDVENSPLPNARTDDGLEEK